MVLLQTFTIKYNIYAHFIKRKGMKGMHEKSTETEAVLSSIDKTKERINQSG